MNLDIGNMNLEKGIVRKDIKFFAWDCVRECNGGNDVGEDVRCAASHLCSYIKRGKCAVQLKYLESLYHSILSTYTYLDEPMLFKIGMQIVPLYAHLVKLQLVELGLPSPSVVNTKGGADIHPVYKEIRETLKTIHVMWKDLDLTISFSPKLRLGPDANKGSGGGGGEDKQAAIAMDRGDPDFHKRLLSSDNLSQKGVIR